MHDGLRLTESLRREPSSHVRLLEPRDLRSLAERVDAGRRAASAELEQESRAEKGQFMTPLGVARLMASMLRSNQDEVRLLDAGAGIGSLLAAAVEEFCMRPKRPRLLRVTAYEIDSTLVPLLRKTLEMCEEECQRAHIKFESEIVERDFIADAAESLVPGLFESRELRSYTCAIQNPPYRKLSTNSQAWKYLRSMGVETTNLYTGFLGATLRLLEPGGELVAITPRSFCNGPYFRAFRNLLLRTAAIHQIHLFESRQKAFKDDDVLQETIIVRAVAGVAQPDKVIVTSSTDCDEPSLTRELTFGDVVRRDDPELFIRIVEDGISAAVVEQMNRFSCNLSELGLNVSTGKVVDFRARKFLRAWPEATTAPLIYPLNFEAGFVEWPRPSKKPQAIEKVEAVQDHLVPNACYVLVKRFTSKEEKRRIVAAVHLPHRIAAESIGFENHLNYFHMKGAGLDESLAKGLGAYLNSTLLDSYFRQFSGHTQVNATDLRNLRYPTADELRRVGRRIDIQFPDQQELDRIISEELMAKPNNQIDPVAAKRKIGEAMKALTDLGFPRAQLNERSALTLLALLGLGPKDPWADATSRHIGITPIMDFMKARYGKEYAPNTRETIRRQTIHQFVQGALILENPDAPDRPTNSPKTVYTIEQTALDLLRSFGTVEWDTRVQEYCMRVPALRDQYAQTRQVKRIPIKLPEDVFISLSPGGQNVLVERIMTDFAEIFTPGGVPLYVGDSSDKHAYYDKEALEALGVYIESHGKMPDVIIYDTEREWLVLVEAVTSHGPINPKRQRELKDLFAGCTVGLVLVTAFLTRKAMVKYLSEISWETEVWVAEAPEHLIHFNGERYLGPY